MQRLIFNFDNASDAAATKDRIVALFNAAGCSVASAELDPRIGRGSGVSYRQVNLLFVDSQTVTLRAKLTGDVYQVLVNGKDFPIGAEEPEAVVGRLAEVLDMGRVAWQKKLARVKASNPGDARVLASHAMEERRILQRIATKSQLAADGRQQLDEIKAQIAAIPPPA